MPLTPEEHGQNPFGKRGERLLADRTHLPATQQNVELVGKVQLSNIARGRVSDVGVHGRYAYLGDFNGSRCDGAGVWIVDISDPRRPREVKYLKTGDGGYIGEGVQAIRINTPRYTGDVLVLSNEPCVEGGLGGGTLIDVTHPDRATPVLSSFGDYDPRPSEPGAAHGPRQAHASHSVFVWTDGPRAYAVLVDNAEAGADIFDISDPRHPVRIAEYQLPTQYPRILQDPDSLSEAFPFLFFHDVVVKKIRGRQFCWSRTGTPGTSSWTSPTRAARSTSRTATSRPSTPSWSTSTAPDRSPRATRTRPSSPLTTGTSWRPTRTSRPTRRSSASAGTGRRPAPWAWCSRAITRPSRSTPVTRAQAAARCRRRRATASGTSPWSRTEPATSRQSTTVSRRREATPRSCWRRGSPARRVRSTSPATGSRSCTRTAANFRSRHSTTTPRRRPSRTARPASPRSSPTCGFGTQGKAIRLQGFFDGWGYVHLYANNNGKLKELDTWAIPEAMNPAYASGYGALSVHEAAASRQRADLVYFSYYGGGFRVASVAGGKLREVGSFVDSRGNDFWGVQVFQHRGQELVAASDRSYGLYLFRYKGR